MHRDRLAAEGRWSHLTRTAEKPPEGYVELGELCRVHRGTVTGANGVWIAGDHSVGLPASVLFPTITKAREVFDAHRGLLSASTKLRCVIDIPPDLDQLDTAERKAVDKFLKVARAMGEQRLCRTPSKGLVVCRTTLCGPYRVDFMARRPPGSCHQQARCAAHQCCPWPLSTRASFRESEAGIS